MRLYSMRMLTLVSLIASFALSSQAQDNRTMHPDAIPMVHMPGTPECFVMATQQGDPGKEASILKMKGGAGCSVPWHWHPSTENIMMVSGTAHTAIKNEKPVQLSAGSFLSVPPKHVMNFVCVRECTLFVYTDGPFAIHYVDDAGKEITSDEALKKK
ncbi:MAG TPA: cupin domain-containing protein [Terriglobales bacterium]|nr:cupin domain-containing protein [Terriglobales bacterium]